MYRIVSLTFFVILGLVVGCSSNGSKVASNSPVLDVAPAAPIPAAEPAVASTPINDSPAVNFAAPSPAPVQTVAMNLAPSNPTGAKTYTVKKGDTLYSIAKTQLGSGKDWQKIAAANPGLTPQKLKAGQQIAMP